jgi:hypothetical protein
MHVWTHLKNETCGKTCIGICADGHAELDDLAGAVL